MQKKNSGNLADSSCTHRCHSLPLLIGGKNPPFASDGSGWITIQNALLKFFFPQEEEIFPKLKYFSCCLAPSGDVCGETFWCPWACWGCWLFIFIFYFFHLHLFSWLSRHGLLYLLRFFERSVPNWRWPQHKTRKEFTNCPPPSNFAYSFR